jgi:hypothetical protein
MRGCGEWLRRVRPCGPDCHGRGGGDAAARMRGEAQLPLGAVFLEDVRLRREAEFCCAAAVIEPVVQEPNSGAVHLRSEIAAALAAQKPTDLEDVHEVGSEEELDVERDLGVVKIMDIEDVVELTAIEELFAVDVDGVYREIEVVAGHGAAPHGELHADHVRAHGCGGENNRLLSVDPQLEMAEEASVVAEEADLRGAGRHQVTAAGGGKERGAADDRQAFDRVEPRLRVHQLRLGRRLQDTNCV